MATNYNNNNSSSSTQQMTDSLCIPRAFPNISKERVWAIFCKAGFGQLDHIDEVLKEDSQGKKFKRFYIHFKEWAEGWEQHRIQLQKDAGEYLKVTYDTQGPNGGWFWKVYANRATKHEKRDDKVVVQLASKVETSEGWAEWDGGITDEDLTLRPHAADGPVPADMSWLTDAVQSLNSWKMNAQVIPCTPPPSPPPSKRPKTKADSDDDE